MEDNKYIETQLQDHELRIRRLEESDVKQQVQLANIDKGLTEVKLLVNESTKEQLKASQKQQEIIEKFTTQTLDMMRDAQCSRNEIKLTDRKELWGIIALAVGALLTYFLGK